MPTPKQVEHYLASFSKQKTGKKIKVVYFGPLSDYETNSHSKAAEIKQMGYGAPYLIAYREGKVEKKAILSTMKIGHGFGHDYRADRVDNLVLSFDSWNNLPGHCKASDLGAFDRRDSSMISLREADEFFLLRKMIKGVEYAKDLDRIFSSGLLEHRDVDRARALAQYLVKIHARKNSGEEREEFYKRKLRDTVGHGECIFGLADSYPVSGQSYLKDGELAEIEKKCVEQRWKLRKYSSRLSQIHGDFHPWNILFQEDPKSQTKFSVLDRSRGEWGEPADDVCALSINYLFYSIRKYGEIKKEYLTLFNEFVETYTRGTKDENLFEAMPLFYAFRALVIASPIWYPELSSENRRKIFNFAQNILDDGRFELSKTNEYFQVRA
ncbi:MAG: aminoglycoside phosphotransferase family protein [Thaumarchaeota archaeon]|nr:aminoglycoside phosphotransferase family protein [Nitrososphaerota archaeon]